ncbi:hypothetical protein ACHAWU_006279 [Discostella pseudostelligera]|uniref:ETFB lysine methyltransferase n=1 Tax=Discostella pseudostelligera TaxID=259834 RepID=A0ABD3MEC3_9STRA
MKSPRRHSFLVDAAALVVVGTVLAFSQQQHHQHRILVLAFQTTATSSPTSLSLSRSNPSKQYHHYRSWTWLNTVSKESTETTLHGGNQDVGNIDDEFVIDDDVEVEDSWVLRQITFLGLTAQPPAKSDEEDGATIVEVGVDIDDDVGAHDDGDDSSTSPTALDARNLSEFLMEIGACSVSITDSDADTIDENPLFDEPDLASSLLDGDELYEEWAMVLPDLAVGRNLWKRCDVSAHFPSSFDIPSIVDAVRYTFQCTSNPRYKVDDVPDLDWIAHVQESWTPIVTGGESKFILRFPWHDDALVMKACQEMERKKMQELMIKQFDSGVKRDGAVVHFESGDFNDDDEDENEAPEATSDIAQSMKNKREYVQIQLEGGIAFGTGEHPTTRLCLGWIRDKVEERLDNTSDDETLHFLDYGAGSGVLGIAAAAVVRSYNELLTKQRRLPSQKSITTVGVEIDADAIRIANDNAVKNNVDMKNYLPNYESLDAEALSVVMRAMQRKRNMGLIEPLPAELNGDIYDLCAANILALPLMNLAPTIASLVKSPGGEIGLSGILTSQAQAVVDAYSEFFNDVKVSGEENGWVLITGKRK